MGYFVFHMLQWKSCILFDPYPKLQVISYESKQQEGQSAYLAKPPNNPPPPAPPKTHTQKKTKRHWRNRYSQKKIFQNGEMIVS